MIEAELEYPVIVVSFNDDNLQEAHLVWMSEKERLDLNTNHLIEENPQVLDPTSKKAETNPSTRYIFLDEQANLRIKPGSLEAALAQASRSFQDERASLNIIKLALSNDLISIGVALDWFLEAIGSRLRDDIEAINSRNLRVADEIEGERITLSELILWRSIFSRLIDKKNILNFKDGEKSG